MQQLDMKSEQIQEFLKLIGKGVDIETAAAYVGIPHALLLGWTNRGKVEETRLMNRKERSHKSEEKYLELYSSIRSAFAKSQVRAQIAIGSAMKEDWKAAAYHLEKTMPHVYGKNADKIQELESRINELES